MKNFTKKLTAFGILLILLFAVCFTACTPVENSGSESGKDSLVASESGEGNTENLTESTVSFVGADSAVPLYTGAEVFVENEKLPLYRVYVNNVHSWSANPTNRDLSGAGYFNLTGKTEVTVKIDGLKSVAIRPLSAQINPTVKDGVAKFIIKSAGNYSVEPDGDPKKAFYLFVSDNAPAASESDYPGMRIIHFKKGLHTSSNSSYISGNTVSLSSNTTVIIDEGAVVRARFVANNASNITITGRGIVDGSTFERNASNGSVTVPFDFNYCNNVRFKDFTCLDPAGWCVNWYFCENSTIDNVKIISSRSNGDGISIQSCKGIFVKNCFLRTWDDSLVVKNYPRWDNKNIEGETRNVHFENCTLWTDLAQSMEIGYETVGAVMDDITFKNITVLHNFHKPVMSIHNGNNAKITNVIYDTVTVEDASMGRGDAGSNNQLCEFATEFSSNWSTTHKTTALGSVDGVTVKNVTVLDGNIITPIRVAGSVDNRAGFGGTHYVNNVNFENIWVCGKKITDKYAYLSVNKYASVTVKEGSSPVLATFVSSADENLLKSYKDHAIVTVN